MSNKLYVGNLSFETLQSDLEDLFSSVGTVREAAVIQDRETSRSRGFGFVTMSSRDEAQEAARKFDGFALQGRNLKVNEAQDKPVAAPKGRQTRRWQLFDAPKTLPGLRRIDFVDDFSTRPTAGASDHSGKKSGDVI